MKHNRILKALELPSSEFGHICVRSDRTAEYVKQAIIQAFRETADYEIAEEALEINFKPYNFKEDDLFVDKEDLKAVEIFYKDKLIDNFLIASAWSEINENALGYIHYNGGKEIESNPNNDWSWLKKKDKEHLESKVFLEVLYYPS